MLIGSTISWAVLGYYMKTKAIPAAGGEYIEGIVGQPSHINPILSQPNEADGDIAQIIFNGLMKYDQDGNLVTDLAKNYETSEDKTSYTFHLRDNVLWHDGERLTADDIIFTANLIMDPAYKSPLRGNWQGVEVESPDEKTVIFKIQTPYAGFLSNLTIGILPKHIWQSVEPDKFALSDFNLEPIGTGPFKYVSPTPVQEDTKGNILSYKLIANPNYFESKPYLSKITFNFYTDENSIIEAYNRKEIMGINELSAERIKDIKLAKSSTTHKFNITRYYAVFFNQTHSLALADDAVREALNVATDRNEIVTKILDGNGDPIYSPFLSGMVGHNPEIGRLDHNIEKANEILEKAGWKKNDDGVRAKDNVKLEITLVTTDWDELTQTAEILKAQWEKAGARVTVNKNSISDIVQNFIKPREYDALLFGQVLGSDPDPFSFWHSSRKKDPGLNLSLFGNSDTDKLIENGRVEFDSAKRAEIYTEFQKELVEEVPAIFLYSPKYIYPVNAKIRGIEINTLASPSKRFSDVCHWYMKTDRVWK